MQMKKYHFKKERFRMPNSKKAEIVEVKSKSLMNLTLDLVELDQDSPENKSYLDETLLAVENKVENYCRMNDFCKSQVDLLDGEIDRLKKVINNYSRIQERLEYMSLMSLETLQVKEIKNDFGYKISRQETKAVEVTHPEQLPDWAVTYKTEKVPKKSAIKEALASGQSCPGAQLVTNVHCRFTTNKKRLKGTTV
jgi:hypothetical protein